MFKWWKKQNCGNEMDNFEQPLSDETENATKIWNIPTNRLSFKEKQQCRKKFPKKTFAYVEVTKPSSNHSNHVWSKEGSNLMLS